MNKIPHNGEVKDSLTRALLAKLLKTKGIRLAMASTILRFKNPTWFQIIDQRAYRFLMRKELKVSTIVEKQIEIYLEYLDNLRRICEEKNIDFSKSDRILYALDQEYNHNLKIKY